MGRRASSPDGVQSVRSADLSPLKRVSVVGSSCSGKSTFSTRLAETLGIAHVELDAIQWLPEWTTRDPVSFRQIALQHASTDAWVIDGNYILVRRDVWDRATSVVWLDLPYVRVLCRLIRRTLRRIASGEELWNGNRETWREAFFSRDSLFLWQLTTFARRRRRFREARSSPENSHLTFYVLRTPHQVEQFLRIIESRKHFTTKPERALT